MNARTRSSLAATAFAVASALVAGIATFGVFVVLGDYQDALLEAVDEEPHEITVPAAARDLPLGRTIQPDDLVQLQIRDVYVPPTAIRLPESIVGRVATERILAGELIRMERLAPPESGHGLDAVIATGMRGRSVNLSGASQVSGFLLPGNRVDVITTLQEGATGAPAETRTLVQGVRILAVDDRTAESAERGIRLKPQVTLELTPADAERVTHAGREGSVRLTLRSDIDFSLNETAGATTSALLGGTPGAERRTLFELRDEAEPVSVVRIIHGGDVVAERVP